MRGAGASSGDLKLQLSLIPRNGVKVRGEKRLKRSKAGGVSSLGAEGSMAKAAIGTRGFPLVLPTS